MRWTRVVPLALPLVARVGLAQAPATRTPAEKARGVTLREAIELARRQNPDVLVARATVDSARAESHIARAFPNPTLAGTPNTPYQYSATLPLDVTPQRFYRTRTASLGESASSFDRADVERQTTLNVARAFFDALLAEEKRQLVGARRATVAQLLAADSLRFAEGDEPARNVARSEVELIRADADLARASAGVRQSRLALQAAIGLPSADTSFAALGSLDYKSFDVAPESLVATARARRPDLSAASTRLAQSASARKSASALLVPTPELSYVRQYTAPFDGGHYYSFGLAFELPSLNLYRGQRERAAAAATAADANYRRVSAQVDRDIESAVADYRVQRGLVDRYRSGLLVKIDSEVSAMRYAYTRGAASQLEVLDAVQVQQDARSEYLEALHDYWLSVYALNAAVGTDMFGLGS